MKLFGYQRGIVQEMCNPEVDEWYGPKSTRTGVTQCAGAVGAYQVRHKHSQDALLCVKPRCGSD